jgi:hypothetical protein
MKTDFAVRKGRRVALLGGILLMLELQSPRGYGASALGDLPPTRPAPANGELDLSQCRAADGFRSTAYLEVAMALQAMPRERAIAYLRQWAGSAYAPTASGTPADKLRELEYRETARQEAQVIVLCRMLFEAPPGKIFRAPTLFQRPEFFGNTTAADWPLLPIALVDGVPFWIQPASARYGNYTGPAPENAASYLDYCLAEMQWTSRHYTTASSAVLTQILEKLLHDPVWRTPLSPADEKFLADQLKPQVLPKYGFHVHSINSAGKYGLLGGYDSSSPEILPPLALRNYLMVETLDGHFPYTYNLTWSDGSKPEKIEANYAIIELWLDPVLRTAEESRGPSGKLFANLLLGNHPSGSSLTVEVTDRNGNQSTVKLDFLDQTQVIIHRPTSKTATGPSTPSPAFVPTSN